MAEVIPAPGLNMKIPQCDVGDAGAEDGEPLTARMDAAAARAERQKAALSAATGQAWGTTAEKPQLLPEAALHQQHRAIYGSALSPTAEIELPGDNELVSIWADAESISTLRARCTELESEGFELRERLVEYEAAEQVRSARLTKDCERLAAQAETSAAENSTLQRQLADLQAAEAAKSHAKAEAESASAAELARLHQELADMANGKAEAESATASEISRLHQQLADLRAAEEASSKAKMICESAASKEISSLRQQLANVRAAEGETSQAKDDVERTLMAENSSLQQQLADLRAAEAANMKEKAEAESAGAAEISSLQQQLADLAKAKAEADSAAVAEISGLRQQVSDLRAAVDASSKAKADAQASVADELASLREQLAIALASENAMAKSKAEEIANLHNQLSSARAAEGASAQARDESESRMTKTIASLRAELSAKAEAESTLAAENRNLQDQVAELASQAEEEKKIQEEEVAELREQIRAGREALDVASPSSALSSPLASPLAASQTTPTWRRPDPKENSQSAIGHERQRAGIQFPARRNVRWYEPEENLQESTMQRSCSWPAPGCSTAASDRKLRLTATGVTEVGDKMGQKHYEADDGLQWKEQTSASETEEPYANEESEEEPLEDEDEGDSLGSEGVYDEEDEEVENAIEELEKFGEEDSEGEEDPYDDEGLWTAGQDDAKELSAVEEEETELEGDEEEEIYSARDLDGDFSARSSVQDSQGAVSYSDKVSLAAKAKFQTSLWTADPPPPVIQAPSHQAGLEGVNRASLSARRGFAAPVGSGTLHPGVESQGAQSMSPEVRPSNESKTPPVPTMALPRASSPTAYTTMSGGRVIPHTTRAAPSFGSPRPSCHLRAQTVGSAGCATGRMPSPGTELDSARALTPSARTVAAALQGSPLRHATQTQTSTPILVNTAAAPTSSSGANPNEAPAPGLLAGAVSAGTAAAAAAANSGGPAAAGPAAGGAGSFRVAQAVRLQGAMVTPVKQRPEDIGRAVYTVTEASGMPVRSLPPAGALGAAGTAPPGAPGAPAGVAGDRGVATPPQCQPRLTYAGVAAVRPAGWPSA